jgi:hypothetical protein
VRRGSDDPAGRVASTAPSVLLPTALREGSAGGALTVTDALAIGNGRWLLVFRVGDELFTSAVVEEEDGFRRAVPGDGVAQELLALTATEDARGAFVFRRLGTIGSWSGEDPSRWISRTSRSS